MKKKKKADNYVSIKEVALLLGKSEVAVRGLVQRGIIPCYKLGKSLLFKLSEIEAAMR